MKPTARVSVGGFVFNIEGDAYQLLENYLNSLEKHFKDKVGGAEIISDIESRMSELLQMRLESVDSIVRSKDAEEVIKIMGTPKDFDEDSETSESSSFPKKNDSKSGLRQKRLYKDCDNKFIAGVCSGLGHYFRIDTTIVRIVFLVLLVSAIPFLGKFSGFIFMTYLILWIVVPNAVSMNQKLEMKGQDPSIENIENRDDTISEGVRGESLVKNIVGIARILISVFLIFLGSTLIFTLGIVVFCYFFTFHSFSPMPDILKTFANPSIIGAAIVFGLLSSVTILYAGIRLGTKRRFILRSLLAIWLISGIYLGSMSSIECWKYSRSYSMIEGIPISTKSDTLFIQYPPELDNPRIVGDNFAYSEENGCSYILPSIQETTIQNDSLATYKIQIIKTAFERTNYLAKEKVEKTHLDYILHDSLLTIKPQAYNKDHRWNRELFRIEIQVPKGKIVKIRRPDNSDKNLFSSMMIGDFD